MNKTIILMGDGSGDRWENTLGGYYSWNTPGNYKVILTAFNDTYPAGISATVIVEVVEKQTYYVSKTGGHVTPFTSWANAATNIQAAVDAASSGDTVLVNDGTYYPGSQITITKDITVKSVNGAEKTIVDGGFSAQTNRCFYLNNGDTIDGFTITNGNGGGVYCYYGGTVANCTISGNSAYPGGGGVYCYYGGTEANCTISGNSVRQGTGGGVL